MKTVETYKGIEIWDGTGIAEHPFFANVNGLNYAGAETLAELKLEIDERLELTA